MSLADVELAIGSALDATTRAVSRVADAAADVLVPLAQVAAGGKRLRARLLLAAHDAHGGPHTHAAAQVAAGVELFQTAALIHDDVLDQADTRRGQPTIHRGLAARHRDARWSADSEHFGIAGAILAGDLALMAAQHVVARGASDLPASDAAAVAELFTQMSQLCTAGQYADMRLAAQPVEALGAQRDEVLAMMRSKTASYTAEFPLALGAACAEAGSPAIAAMRAIGVPLGIAFQLRDDVLGLVGSPELTGKPAGDDVREGKRTLLMVHAWNHADAAARAAIAAAFARPEASDAAVERAVDAIVSSGARGEAEMQIGELAAQARAALAEASVTMPNAAALSQLEELLDATTHRTA